MLQIMEIARSLFFFLLAGLCEIGGGYLMWLCIREGRGLAFALLGGAILVLYGTITHLSAGKLRSGLCSLRRHIHSSICIGRGLELKAICAHIMHSKLHDIRENGVAGR